jgi:hypothetical protein
MGLLSGLLGNASAVDVADVEASLKRILIPGEEVHRAYKVIRDLFIFTAKRLILVDKQGLTGAKTAYLSIPYKSIRLFSVETAGTFEMDADLKIWVAGMNVPLEKKFPRGETIYEVQMALAHYVTQ